jgi:hypothetical protein
MVQATRSRVVVRSSRRDRRSGGCDIFSSAFRRRPRVGAVDPDVGEVLYVPGRQTCTVGPADSGDLRVIAADRRSFAFATVDDLGICRSRSGIERQDVIGEPAEHLLGCLAQRRPAPAFGKPLDAVQDLGPP